MARMKRWSDKGGRVLSTVTAAVAIAVFGGCGGGSANVHSEMPKELAGLDVVIEPGVQLTGEGAKRYATFKDVLVSSVESQLVNDGFDIVPPERAGQAVHVQMHATIDISKSPFLKVNGKPLESTEAHVQVKVVSADGALLDSFDVPGDPD